MPDRRGRLVAVEGIDGCGKSTQVARLGQAMGALCTFEPGATELGVALRRLLLDPGPPHAGPRAETLVLAADRAQHVADRIVPALERGAWVVTDRYVASTFAYQGHGRGLPAHELAAVLGFATSGLCADLTILIDLPVEEAGRRTAAQRRDKMEQLGATFQERVRAGYLQMASSDPDGWVVVDGSHHPDVVAADVRRAVVERLGPWPAAGAR